MSFQQAHLPVYPDGHNWSRNQIELFKNQHGQLIIPPNFFDVGIKRNLRALTKVVLRPPGRTQETVLTEKGEIWTDQAYAAYPFFDKDQRDEFGKPCVKRIKSSESKLAFALLIQKLFGSGPFVDHLHAALRDEMIRRCTEMDLRLASGATPCSIQDVLSIFKTDEMKQRYKNGKKSLVYNWMLYVVKSLTDEAGIGWVENAVQDYLPQQSIDAVLAPGQSDGTRRHSLVKFAVKKGAQSTKESLKDLEVKHFGATLILNEQVHFDRDNYKERMVSGKWEVVYLDPRFVPKSCKDCTAYWVKRVEVDAKIDFEARLTNVVGDGIELNFTCDEMTSMVNKIYDGLTSGRNPESRDSNGTDNETSSENDISNGAIDIQVIQNGGNIQAFGERVHNLLVSFAFA
jgi:hypothetical protein